MEAVHVAQRRMTADEFLALPVPEHGRPWNLVEGEVVVSQATALQNVVQGRLFIAIGNVEVRSPTTWRYDVAAKKAGYERHGLRELWLVDTPARQVLAFRRSTAGAPAFDRALELGPAGALSSPLLPGLAVALDELFATD